DGLLGDLNQNLLTGLEQLADGRKIGRLHGTAATATVAATAAFPVPCPAGMTDTVSTSAVSTTAISATTTTIALARPNKRCAILIEVRCGGQFNTIGELITCLSLFGFSLVEIVFFVRDFAEAAVVAGVFLFEIVLVL